MTIDQLNVDQAVADLGRARTALKNLAGRLDDRDAPLPAADVIGSLQAVDALVEMAASVLGDEDD